MNFPDEETMIWAKKKFGAPYDAAKQLFRLGNIVGSLPSIPAGVLDTTELAFYKVWDDTPTIEQLNLSLFGSKDLCFFMMQEEEHFMNTGLYLMNDVPFILFGTRDAGGDPKNTAMAVCTQTFQIEDFVFEAGIYFREDVFGDFEFLTYRLNPING